MVSDISSWTEKNCRPLYCQTSVRSYLLAWVERSGPPKNGDCFEFSYPGWYRRSLRYFLSTFSFMLFFFLFNISPSYCQIQTIVWSCRKKRDQNRTKKRLFRENVLLISCSQKASVSTSAGYADGYHLGWGRFACACCQIIKCCCDYDKSDRHHHFFSWVSSFLCGFRRCSSWGRNST